MKQIPGGFQSFLLLLVLLLASSSPVALKASRDADVSTEFSRDTLIPSGCSVFTLSKGEQVFFGGNDDYITSDSYYWVDPGGTDHYGVIWIGQPDNVQQGVNECGLAYDANGLPRVDVNPHPERVPVQGDYTSYPIHILHECATVEEVIAWVNAHQWHSYMHDQMHFADATGDAVIISASPDGELAFTRKPRGDGFLVSTNFNVADPSNGYSYPCWRYDRAQELLGQMVHQEGELTARDASGVLDVISQQGATSWTISSLLADLTHGQIYLYYFYQFDRPVVLNMTEELANPRAPGPLSQLFPDDVRQEAASRYQQIQAKNMRCRWVGLAWLALVLVSLVILLVLPDRGWRGLWLWVPAVFLLGPLALLARLIARRSPEPGTWRTALPEITGDMMPTIAAFVSFLLILLLVPAVQSNPLLQFMLVLFLPLLLGWIIFHGLLLTPATEKGRWHFLCQRLPHVMVVANIGMGGICVMGMFLVNLSLNSCPLLPLSIWTVVSFWVIGVLGALISGSLIAIYEFWAIRRGFRAWSVIAGGEGEVRTPSWHRLWWWILLSYGILFGGIALGVFLQKMLG